MFKKYYKKKFITMIEQQIRAHWDMYDLFGERFYKAESNYDKSCILTLSGEELTRINELKQVIKLIENQL